MNKEEVKDYIDHALTSSRGLTSDLASDITRKMKEQIDVSVSTGIEKYVNGKINKLTTIVEDHVERDNAWKEEYTPYIKGIASVSDGGKIVGKIIVFIAAVGAAILAIRKWLI